MIHTINPTYTLNIKLGVYQDKVIAFIDNEGYRDLTISEQDFSKTFLELGKILDAINKYRDYKEIKLTDFKEIPPNCKTVNEIYITATDGSGFVIENI